MEQTNNQSQTLYPMKQEMTVPPGMGAPVAPNVPGIAGMAEGGLLQEGGSVDPVSGNEVPAGSLKEEVRDDIPAKLSEGEFVFPADVVRFIGLERLMQLRQEAKEGLRKMEAMGQMGNADEATMDDNGDFETDIDDIISEVEAEASGVEMAEGGMPAPTMPEMPPEQAPAPPTPDQQMQQAMPQPAQAMRPSQIIQQALAKDGTTPEDKKEFETIVTDVANDRAFMMQQNNTVFVGARVSPGKIGLITYTADDPDMYQDAVTKFIRTAMDAKIQQIDPAISSPDVITALNAAGAEGMLSAA
jgi:hypothetical protein